MAAPEAATQQARVGAPDYIASGGVDTPLWVAGSSPAMVIMDVGAGLRYKTTKLYVTLATSAGSHQFMP
jgi:hypothetical protein